MNNDDELIQQAGEIYDRLPRKRYIERHDEARRGLAHLLAGCRVAEQTRPGGEVFGWAVAELADTFGLNLLRPVERAARKFPAPLTDPVTKETLANPYGTERERQVRAILANDTLSERDRVRAQGELAAIRREQAALEKMDPALAEHMRRSAVEPYTYAAGLAAEEEARLAQNQAEEVYFRSPRVHAENPFVTGDKAEQRRRVELCDPEMVALLQREAKAIELPLWGKRTNRTLRAKIAKANPLLNRILEAGDERERQLEVEAHEREERKRAQALEFARRAEAARVDARHNVRRYSDGRIVTGGAAAA